MWTGGRRSCCGAGSCNEALARFARRLELGHAFDLHVAALELPLAVLLEEDGADEADGAVLVGE